MKKEYREIFNMLNGENTVSINRYLIHVLGTHETFLYQSLIGKNEWYKKRGKLDRDGFFYATADDIYESTALTRRQQERIIKILVDLGLIETKLKGLPAKKHFRIVMDCDILEELLTQGKNKCEELRKNREEREEKERLEKEFEEEVRRSNYEIYNTAAFDLQLENLKKEVENQRCIDDTEDMTQIQQKRETVYDSKSNKTKANKTKANKTLKDNPNHQNIINQVIEKIDYDNLENEMTEDEFKIANGVINLIDEVDRKDEEEIKVGKEKYDREKLLLAFLELNRHSLLEICQKFRQSTGVTNPKQYLFAILVNELLYPRAVKHDTHLQAHGLRDDFDWDSLYEK